MDDHDKCKLLARLRRISGQVDGIARMAEQDRSCAELLLQISSAQAALGQSSKLILRSHMENSVTELLAMSKPSERKQKLDQLTQLLFRYARLGMKNRK